MSHGGRNGTRTFGWAAALAVLIPAFPVAAGSAHRAPATPSTASFGPAAPKAGPAHESAHELRYRGQTAPFWRELHQPGYRRSRTLLRHGLQRLIDLAMRRRRHPLQPGSPGPGGLAAAAQARAERAILRFRRAHEIAPKDPEALYLLATARSLWRAPQTDSFTSEDRETLHLFEELRRLDPGYHSGRVAFELGILYTRKRNFARAGREYERCLQRLMLSQRGPPTWRLPQDPVADTLFGPVSAVTARYNLGDVTMAQQKLQKAVDHYRQAVETARASSDPRDFRTHQLALWGLAVALDRLGEHKVAVERAREAIQLDDRPMKVLHADGVFFEPSYELHYYEALGYMALADKRPEDSDPRLEALRQAKERWHQFLEAGGAQSPWADRAETHLDQVQARIAETSEDDNDESP